MEEIVKWADGNPGALMFLMTLIEPENFMVAVPIVTQLKKLKSIRGTNLYVLYSDLCNKDLNKVEKLCNDCPAKILEDACSRQDYSGKKLIAQYLV